MGRRLSDFPPPSQRPLSIAPRVVTIGGGHGQAALLGALTRLACDITAIVSVADDGGCSGKLREEVGMPPPGDLRRCLVALSRRGDLARRFEDRLTDGTDSGSETVLRSVGNLVLAEMFHDLGGLQVAVDWASTLLGCVGRVIPVAETAGILRVYDMQHGPLSGESAIERRSETPIVVTVEGPTAANPEAIAAVLSADIVFIGPGSFVGSTLAAVTTGDLATALVATRARRVLVQNLEREGTASYGVDQHLRILVDHIVIKSGGDSAIIDTLSHREGEDHADACPDGSVAHTAEIARPGEHTHDEALLADALARHFGLARAETRSLPEVEPAALEIFEDALTRARRRLLEA